MKGGAWFCLEAFKDVARRGTAARPLVFLVTPDEEIGSPITRPMIEDLGRRSAYALVTEPARDGGQIVTARKGVGRFDVHVEGRPAHAGSRHKDGRNAIYEAARQILAIEAMTDYSRGITTTRRHGLRRHGGEHHSAALPLPRGSAGRDGGRRRGRDGGAPRAQAAATRISRSPSPAA